VVSYSRHAVERASGLHSEERATKPRSAVLNAGAKIVFVEEN